MWEAHTGQRGSGPTVTTEESPGGSWEQWQLPPCQKLLYCHWPLQSSPLWTPEARLAEAIGLGGGEQGEWPGLLWNRPQRPVPPLPQPRGVGSAP